MHSLHFSDVNIHYHGDLSGEIIVNEAYEGPPRLDFAKAETSLVEMATAALKGEDLALTDQAGKPLVVSAATVRQAVGAWAIGKEREELEGMDAENVFERGRLRRHVRQWAGDITDPLPVRCCTEEGSPIVSGSGSAVKLARSALIHAARKLGYDDGLAAPGPFTDTTPQTTYDRVVELQQAGDFTTIDEEFGPGHYQMAYPDGDKHSSWLWPRLGLTDSLIEEADPSGDTHTMILSHYAHAYQAAWRAEVIQVATRHQV